MCRLQNRTVIMMIDLGQIIVSLKLILSWKDSFFFSPNNVPQCNCVRIVSFVRKKPVSKSNDMEPIIIDGFAFLLRLSELKMQCNLYALWFILDVQPFAKWIEYWYYCQLICFNWIELDYKLLVQRTNIYIYISVTQWWFNSWFAFVAENLFKIFNYKCEIRIVIQSRFSTEKLTVTATATITNNTTTEWHFSQILARATFILENGIHSFDNIW